MNAPNQLPNEPWLISIAASAGGIEALKIILSALPCQLPAAVVVVQHRVPSERRNGLRALLQQATKMPVVMAEDRQIVQPGTVYIARSDLHLTIAPERRFSYVDGRRIRFLQSSANPLLESAATVFKNRLIAVVLTGSGSDATDGVQSVKAQGGLVIAQDPATAQHSGMPSAAVASGAVDLVLSLDAIPATLDAIVHGRPIANGMQPT
jgi:two-component system chemotaxis response regulator CheB